MVFGDDKALAQMATNIIDNAIKYTSPLGTVTVTIKAEKDCVEFSVQDDGLGIDLDDQQRIFERFYRVDKARSKSLGGTGLGLAIVKHIVQSHRGTLNLKSVINQGSTFTITLPLSDTKN
jgi:two-component system phosphate regulon sensor histidine kinase PhoR